MTAGTKWTPEKRKRFFAELTQTCNVTLSARAIGQSRSGAYKLRAADDSFAQGWDEALQEGIDLLEHEAHRRAFRGVDEPVFYQGAECGVVKKYSDTLSIFLLKAHRPETYRDNWVGRLEVQTVDPRKDVERALDKLAAAKTEAGVAEEPDAG